MTPRSVVKSAISRVAPLGLTSRLCAPVLTYHACYEEAPPNIAHIDNVSPQWLYDQLRLLKRRFRFVPVDELCEAKQLKGIAAVTFDDGYQSVMVNALPLMSALEIPFTIFVNTSALEGKVLWRHKLVYVLENGLSSGLADSASSSEDLYRAWKQPRYSSRVLEEKLDAILQARKVVLPNHLCEDRSYFIKHPLVWYGNHSHSHYVLASLSRGEQFEEIRRTRDVLDGIPGVQVSRVFSLPFGETHHANSDTLSALRELGYRAILMNRGGVNLGKHAEVDGTMVIERFSPNEQDIPWQFHREFAVRIKQLLIGTA